VRCRPKVRAEAAAWAACRPTRGVAAKGRSTASRRTASAQSALEADSSGWSGLCLLAMRVPRTFACQPGLEVVPDHLDVIEFGGVFGQPLDREPVCTSGEGGKRELADMDQHDGLGRPAGHGAVEMVELLQMRHEVAAALGGAGMDDEFGRGSKRGYSWSRVDVAGLGNGTLSFSGAVRDGSMCWRSSEAARE